jgi:LysR family transcriptional regulator, nitrogen assimilation regulatory protein
MELRQIEAFVHVAVHGSFTRAAEILGTNQPALSRLVRALEVELRQTLLLRNGRGAVPTAAGDVLLRHCQEILQHVQRARDAMLSLQGTARQKLALGLVPHIAQFAILPLVRDLRLEFPRARITVVEGASTTLLEQLLAGAIDAAIMYETPRSELIDKRTLLREELYFVGPAASDASASAADHMRFDEVARYPLIISSRRHAIREVVEAQAARHQVKLNIAFEVDAVPSALDLVQEGYGYALLPLNALARDTRKRQLSLSRVSAPTLHCRLVLATGRQLQPGSFVHTALEVLERRILPVYEEHRRMLYGQAGVGSTMGSE